MLSAPGLCLSLVLGLASCASSDVATPVGGGSGGAGGANAAPDGGGSEPAPVGAGGSGGNTAPGGANGADAPAANDLASEAGATADAPPRPDGGATDSGGPPENPDLDARCTVPVTFTNRVPNSAGGQRFNTTIPDPTATIQALSRADCHWLYRKPEEVRTVSRITLIIDNLADGNAAETVGAQITFAANYIGSLNNLSPADLAFELNGVLAHELTHVWQNDGGGGNLVEAMADYVRYRAGFDRLSRRHRGGNYTDPYTVGGFFIVWVEDKYDGNWGYKINQGMRSPSFNYGNFIMQTFGKSAAMMWAAYQADIPP